MAKVTVRLGAVQVVFWLAFVALLGRAGYVQLVEGAQYAATADAQRTDRLVLPAPRGTIYDRNGLPLALTQEVYHVGVADNELCPETSERRCDRNERVRAIAKHVGVGSRDVERALADGYAYFHGPYTSSQVEPIRGIRGVHLTSELVRFYPDPDFARMTIGRPEAEGRPASGIERMLDSALTGVDGHAVVLRDRSGRRYESPSRLDQFPVPGADVYLTLDAELQEIIERTLADAIDRYDAMGGDVVVLNPETGDLLAVASLDARGHGTSGAFTSVFEPGSTAKVFAAAALLERGLVRPTDSVWTENGVYHLGARTITDDHPAGWLTLRGVIEESSNIGMVKFSRVLASGPQYTTLRSFGVGTPTGVEFPAESPGILKRPNEWSGTTAASLTIGYELAVTPMQLAQAYAAIANDGVMMRPALVKEIRAADGTVRYHHIPEPVRRVVPPEVARELRDMLRGVVYSDGTGTTAALTAYEVAGKTGTARRAGPGGYVPGSHIASFASMFPAGDPQLVMVVKLDDPKGAYARLTAAPVTRQVLEELLAARSGAINPARLATKPAVPEPAPAIGAGTVPFVMAWPPPAAPESTHATPVPDVLGLPMREAIHRLHEAGFRVRLSGWGKVKLLAPSAGAAVPPGTLVTVTGAGERPTP